MEVVLGDYNINVIIERKRNKNVYFRFKDGNNMYVSCNRLVSEVNLRKMIKDNEFSLLKLYEKSMEKAKKEEIFTYLGEPYTIVYDESLKEVNVDRGIIFCKNEKVFSKWYLKECERVFQSRIEYCLKDFSNIPKFSLRLRRMTSRWGVNNVTKKIITLNTELLKKDISLIDYVIVHELCHFYEANHSDRFWYQVSLRYPEYKLARKRLKG